MSEADPYKLWEVIGVWAGSISTFLAVVVSLRLASRAERPRLAVSADERIYIDPSEVEDRSNVELKDFPLVIILSAVNTGPTRVRVNSIGWHWILIRGVGALQNPPEVDRRTRPEWPTLLEHGDTLQWILERDDLIPSLATHMLAPHWWWRLRLELMCVTVSTTTGHSFRARLGPTVKKSLAAETHKLRSSPPTSG